MKTLANCTPREFLIQTNKIRRAAEHWLDVTRLNELRRRLPNIDPGATEDQRREALARQINRNVSDMLSAMLEDHPEETLELVAGLCFIEPEALEQYTVPELLRAITEILDCPEVLDFFLSLARWEGMRTSTAARVST